MILIVWGLQVGVGVLLQQASVFRVAFSDVKVVLLFCRVSMVFLLLVMVIGVVGLFCRYFCLEFSMLDNCSVMEFIGICLYICRFVLVKGMGLWQEGVGVKFSLVLLLLLIFRFVQRLQGGMMIFLGRVVFVMK